MFVGTLPQIVLKCVSTKRNDDLSYLSMQPRLKKIGKLKG